MCIDLSSVTMVCKNSLNCAYLVANLKKTVSCHKLGVVTKIKLTYW